MIKSSLRRHVVPLGVPVLLIACLAGFMVGGIAPAYAAGLVRSNGPAPQSPLCTITYYRVTEQASMTHSMNGGTFTFKAKLWSKVDLNHPGTYCGVSYAQAVVSVPTGGKINKIIFADDYDNTTVVAYNLGSGTHTYTTRKASVPRGNADLEIFGIDGIMDDYLITNAWP